MPRGNTRSIENGMNSVAKFAFSGLLIGGLAYAQAPSEPAAASAMVSPADSSIKPVPAAQPDTSTDADADIVADPVSLLPDLPPVPPHYQRYFAGDDLIVVNTRTNRVVAIVPNVWR